MTTGKRLQVNVSLTDGSNGGDRPGKSYFIFQLLFIFSHLLQQFLVSSLIFSIFLFLMERLRVVLGENDFVAKK